MIGAIEGTVRQLLYTVCVEVIMCFGYKCNAKFTRIEYSDSPQWPHQEICTNMYSICIIRTPTGVHLLRLPLKGMILMELLKLS